MSEVVSPRPFASAVVVTALSARLVQVLLMVLTAWIEFDQ